MTIPFHVVIPARHASSRLPGKPLLPLAGRPMVEHVWRRACESGAAEVVIATDHEGIAETAAAFGAEVCMTAADHPSGTDRLSEVVALRGWSDERIVVNLQGDEPLMPPALVRQVAEDLHGHADAVITTLCTPISSRDELFDPHAVKVVRDERGYALYFSRAPIPWDRDRFAGGGEALAVDAHFRHVGIYAYRAGFLRHYAELPPSDLERLESLEQLRVLSAGYPIHVSVTATPPGHGVDTREDVERVERLLGGG